MDTSLLAYSYAPHGITDTHMGAARQRPARIPQLNG